MITCNHLIDGDTGSHPQSPKHRNGNCPVCEGTGVEYISCCGDDIRNTINESDLCPTCLEHCGDEGEDCSHCNGTGSLSKFELEEYYS